MAIPKPYKHPKTGVFYFRRKVPTDCVQSVGQSWWIRSLKTKDERQADVRIVEHYQQSQQQIDRIRGGYSLSNEEAKQVGFDFVQSQPQPELIAVKDSLDLEAQLDGYLNQNGYDWLGFYDRRNVLGAALSWADHELRKIRLETNQTKNQFRQEAGIATGPTITTVMQRYLNERQPSNSTAADVRTVVDRFQTLHSNLAVTEIEKRHVVALKDALLERGLAPATIKKQLNLFKRLLSWSVGQDLVQTNVGTGVVLSARKIPNSKTERLSFENADLKKIFESPVFMDRKRPQGGAGEAAYWIPVIGLLTGARLGEICQLKTRDIQIENGIRFFDITDIPDDAGPLKTPGSRRRVPVHPKLIELGFDEYLKTLGPGSLFPLIRRNSHGSWSGNFSKWFNRYLRSKVGIKDKRKVFHSFRHSFKDLCRVARVPLELHDQLTGHSSGTVSSGYGRGWLVEESYREISKIKCPVEIPSNVSVRN